MEDITRRDFIRKAGLATALTTTPSLAGGLEAAGQTGGEQDIRLKCIADTWISTSYRARSYTSEKSPAFDNHGAALELVVEGLKSFALFEFDVSRARGLAISQAKLRFHIVPQSRPLILAGISTISGVGSWGEGKQTEGRAKAGAANFFFARTDEQPWAYPGSELADVTFGPGGSLYAYRTPEKAGGDWYEIDLPVQMVLALVSGDQFGLMLTDEKGQTEFRHLISSRETHFPPELLIQGSRAGRAAPGPVQSFKSGTIIESLPEEARALGRTFLRPGSVVLHFGGAGDDAGRGVATRYEVSYAESPIDEASFECAAAVPRWCLNPLVPKTHPFSTSNETRDEVFGVVEQLAPGKVYYFAARATGEGGRLGPVTPLGRYRASVRTSRPLPPRPAPKPARDHHAPAMSTKGVKVWAFPDMLKVNPQTGALLEMGGFSQHRIHNSVWDASISTVTLVGARNEFVAFQIAIESPTPLSGVQVKVGKPVFDDAQLPKIFEGSGGFQLYREYFVPEGPASNPHRQWYPDPLVPLEGAFNLPAGDNPVPGQTVQPVFVDVYIPHGAAPGQHMGTVLVQTQGQPDKEVTVKVTVVDVTLPDSLNFVVDLNCYGGVNSGYDIPRGTPRYRSLAHAYYRLAHLHRTNLDVLGYSQRGEVNADFAPPLEGQGARTTITSWKDWDQYFAPLLDGSAFDDLPRASIPITNMYLPFFENWPAKLHSGYKFDYPQPRTQQEYRKQILQQALHAGPIQDDFTKDYKDRFSLVAKQFADHFRKNHWTRTRYLVYFNNKYYWKKPPSQSEIGYKTPHGGGGSSWWLLDEPNHYDDFRAISFFGHLAKRWLGEFPDVPIILRTDISRVNWIRDLLAGQIDLECASILFFQRNRFLLDNRNRCGREYWNYGTSNSPSETNVAMRSWCWRVWLGGGDGLLPWCAVKGMDAWQQATPLTVFYVGKKFGKDEPFASLRLKAYRRGQQDVEYLVALARKPGWNRQMVTEAVDTTLARTNIVAGHSDTALSVPGSQQPTDEELDRLRLRIVDAIMQS